MRRRKFKSVNGTPDAPTIPEQTEPTVDVREEEEPSVETDSGEPTSEDTFDEE